MKNLRGIRWRKAFYWHKPWPNWRATFLLEIFTLIIAPKWGMADENIMLKGVYEETLTDPNFQLVLVSQNHERKSGPKFNYTNLVSNLLYKSNYHYFHNPTYQTHPSLYLPICVSACSSLLILHSHQLDFPNKQVRSHWILIFTRSTGKILSACVLLKVLDSLC